MSSTVIAQHTAPNAPPALGEEKIASGCIKFGMNGGGDLAVVKVNSNGGGGGCGTGCKSSPGSLFHAASALTSLVKGPNNNKAEATAEQAAATEPEQPKPMDEDDDENFEIPLRFTKSGRKRAVPFPLKLMKVLSHKEYSDIITWLPDGKSFIILKPKTFVSEILSKESGLGFKAAKYSSFTRKLHRWGFLRHYRGDEAGAFYHDLFIRDRLDLVEKMTCNKVEPSALEIARLSKPTTIQPPPQQQQQLAASSKSVSRQPSLPTSVHVPAPPRPSVVAEHLRHVSRRPLMPSHPLQRASLPLASQNISNSEQLNVAIELEVTRRLKERIAAAAMSRHALAMMQQQISYPGAAAAAAAAAGMGLRGSDARSLHWNSVAMSRRASNPLSSMTSLPMNHLMLSKSRAMLNHPAMMEFSARQLGVRPSMQRMTPFQSNIEGAKTA